MPRLYTIGDIIKGGAYEYKIIKLLNQGNFAISYKANSSIGDIFLKQYIDPTPSSGEIFYKFITHQEKVKNILDSIDIVEKNYEYFQYDNCYFQAKEFMQGKDLDSRLNDTENPPSDDDRFLFATVLMYGIRTIHKKGIVHTDLKPEQIYLKHNPTITLKYEVKIIDFDFCRIPGVSEPPHIAGTPFYKSPEHLKGEKPDFKSDIFTCGIMLYQILGGTEPYIGTTEEEYKENVLGYRVHKKLKELNPDVSDELSELVFKMLDPNSTNRPDASQVHELLLKELDKRRSRVSPIVTTSKIPIRIEFVHPAVRYPVTAYKTTKFGRKDFRAYPNYNYLEREQFEIIKTASSWKIKGFPTSNPTFLNNSDCTNSEMELTDGSTVKIGNFEIKIRFVYS